MMSYPSINIVCFQTDVKYSEVFWRSSKSPYELEGMPQDIEFWINWADFYIFTFLGPCLTI